MKTHTGSPYALLRHFLKPYYGAIFLGLLVMLITDICQLFIPEILGGATAHFKELYDDPALGVKNLNWNFLWAYAVLITVLFITRHYWRWLSIGAARKTGAAMKAAFFDHLMSLPQEDVDEMKTGDLMSRVTSDISAIERMTAFAFVIALDCAVHIGCILPLLYIIDQDLFMAILPPLIIGPIIFQIARHKLYGASRVYQEMTADLASIAQENFSGISVIKSFAREKKSGEQFQKQSGRMLLQRIKIVFWESFLGPMAFFLVSLAVALSLREVAPRVLDLNSGLTLDEMVKFVLYLKMLEWPTRAVGMVVGMLQKGKASLDRMNDVFSKEPQQLFAENQASAPEEVLNIEGDFDFRNLNFFYKDKQVLFDITVNIPRGLSVGLIGKVGSGKSSFLSLIPRLYQAPAGSLFLDGRDILDYPIEKFRRRLGFVSQESLLFSESIRNNVLFGCEEEKSEAWVRECLARAQVLEDIENLPLRLEAMLGERGVNLSGGQKQRITLARALAVEPDVYLFDDCFSALDASTEKTLMKALKEICKDHTTFIASHRMSTVKHCDLILVFEGGRIVDRGSPEELLKKEDSYFARITAQQALETEE